MASQASSDRPWPRVSVAVPALNEASNLPHVFSRLPADVHELIVVDGHSVDDTIAVARQLRPQARHEYAVRGDMPCLPHSWPTSIPEPGSNQSKV